MARSDHSSSIFIGLITDRSVDVASPADQIWYSIQVENEDGVEVYDGIVPQDHYRLSSVFDLDLIPFEIGQRVPVGVSRFGAKEYIDILAGELPNAGACA